MTPAPTARRSAFTLTELLIVMGVIGALSVLTLVSMRAIAKDARLASATNTLTASLENARALAMKRNNIVLIVFRPRMEGVEPLNPLARDTRKVVVDIVTCHWTGESYVNLGNLQVIDRFVPIPDAPVRTLPRGIKVAAPSYALGFDEVWVTQSHLPATARANSPETPGVIFGVMYDPDGTTISSNAQSDSDLIWVDAVYDPTLVLGPFIRNESTQLIDIDPRFVDLTDPTYYVQAFSDDETFVVIAPFLAVYDDDVAREFGRPDQWNQLAVYEEDLVGDPNDPDEPGYITENANRIHFNRYTGVVTR